ncbi:indolepyruvate ferredoxin oxidoreductase family protein [Burkholderia gladioli]|uniref:Indolepyruvate ferredoxin oxidoreductase n=1 Tax=Burkholderia gladioli (strain BSR3) TaxID=999541 RepID=F2LHN4_BURGS|nr:indolepyruvate ferredoxin oxidoreductase family protein [Burkholderia gladioli]AEA58961.1 indolepyruvate ferredoxin oxidoreductase [Burkholderia gladioli BSR3]MBW5287506.1 indolepyruvate ferredoxin oxidoreductase family protein [Burkholderia gladioli]
MNAPLDAGQRATLEAALQSVTLDDKYTLERGRAYMSGVQALVRLPMLQQERDRAAGLNTAGFISGYRGSPLGGLDQSLWKAQKHLAAHRIVFQPGLNEDLAATAVWGTQQVNLYPGAKYDGVFGMWYGKGPGVDRSGDVLKHANSAGSSPHGGVLVLAGDDHAAKSSTLAHQSEHLLKACGLPVLYPSNVQEYLDFGLHGWAMSRYSGLWVSLKCVTDVVESSASVDIDPHRANIVLPEDFLMPEGGLNIRWPDPPLVQEARMIDHKWYAALAYVRANRLDRIEIDSPQARFGIMTAGKAYLDVRQALTDLGLDDQTCARIGIRLYKVGCVWPLEAQGAQQFARGLDEILVVEEKRQILEYAIKEELYNWPDGQRPRIFGKFDEKDGAGGEWSVPMGNWLLPAHYELSPAIIAKAIATRLEKFELPAEVRARIAARVAVIQAKEAALARPHVTAERKPWFCSGCPHNTSTVVPEGSRAIAGIGCHYMTVWMDRNTSTFSQMGGEGVPWIGQAPFTEEKHVFANLGDGTYFHSGLLAVRAAIASKANITYKILYNDAVAMTGGQPVDGTLTVPQITHQVAAEGAARIVIVSDEPEKYQGKTDLLAPGVTIHHRDTLDAVQRELREIAGTSILIYDQTCATEKRRRRKRGAYPDPAKRVVINEAVCEGCGDCSVQSNCLSVEPLETEFGTKRQINQSTCNKDFSCAKGFCPSFVSVEGAQLKKPKAVAVDAGALPPLPEPELPAIGRAWGVLVTGVGGTGVVTIGALIGMAAHLENKGVTVLDVTGLAQKGGAVMSHVQIAHAPADIHATRIAMGEADLVIGGDALVTASDECTSRMRHGSTRVVVNSARTPTAEFIKNPQWAFPGASAEQDIRIAAGEFVDLVDADQFAAALLGDTIYTNPFVLGYAWQRGGLPLTLASLTRAIELNGVQVEKNLAAFDWGRRAAHDLASVRQAAAGRQVVPSGATVIALHTKKAVDTLIAKRVEQLGAYQNAAYAARFSAVIERVRAAEARLDGEAAQEPLTEAVARNLYKLMAYKDEYEVARLQSDPAFLARLAEQFEGELKLRYHLAPPILAKRDAQGHLVKKAYGPWMLKAFRLLARFKGLRGTAFDPFGRTEERRTERALIGEYVALVETILAGLTPERLPLALELAKLPDGIRGYGHVKENNLRAVRTKWEALLAQWNGPQALTRHVA